MATKTIDRYIESTPDVLAGKPRIAGRRIAVQDIVIWHELLGNEVNGIAAQYSLGLAEIYAALAYYFDHREEIDNSMREQEGFLETLRSQVGSKISL
jgi:uncharacterized protein (DUF433 family)